MTTFLKTAEVLDGTYEGLWGGHSLRFRVGSDEFLCETDRGIRGMNVPVTFTVSGGDVDEGSIETNGPSTISN